MPRLRSDIVSALNAIYTSGGTTVHEGLGDLLQILYTGRADYLRRDGTQPPLSHISWDFYRLTDLADGIDPADAVTKDQLDAVAATITYFEWQPSALSYITDNTLPPPTLNLGDRYVLSHDGGIPHVDWDGAAPSDIVEYDGSVWQSITPTVGTFIAMDDQNDRLYLWGGLSWDAKYFETTTASTGLLKTGFDIQIDPTIAGDGLAFDPLGVLSVDLAIDPGLEFELNKLRVKIKALGGITRDSDGLSVNPSEVDHDSLSGAGTNTHADIDTHIGSSLLVHGIADTSDLALQSGNLTQFASVPLNDIRYVDRHRSDIYIEDGTREKPYKTIQAAVDAIAALNQSKYFVIDISSGIYQENITLEDAGLRYLKLQGHGYVSINPASGNALSSAANNNNLIALHISGIGFARPVVFTGSNGASSFADVILTDCSFTGNSSFTATCINNVSMQGVYSERPFSYTNVTWSNIQNSQLQGTWSFTADSTQAAPAWGANGTVQMFGSALLGQPTYNIGGVATYTVAVIGSRWGSSAVGTIPAGVTIFAYSSFIRGTITNNGTIHLRSSTIEIYAGGAGTLNLNAQPASQIANDSSVSGTTVKNALETLDAKVETDPVFSASPAAGIASGDITNWDTAYGWGDHSAAGYLTEMKATDDADPASAANVGKLRYRVSGNNSYVDMSMQTGAATYAWVNIVTNSW